MRKKLTSILAAGALMAGLTGCGPEQKYEQKSIVDLRNAIPKTNQIGNIENVIYTEIEGVPYPSAIGVSDDSSSTCISFMISDNEKPIMCSSSDLNKQKASRAGALINAAIARGNGEQVKVKGRYNLSEKVLYMEHLTSGDYTIDLH